MSWPASILAGFLIAAFAAVYALFVAKAAVEWLQVPGFEGAAGYFVLTSALLALIGGLVVGILVSHSLGGPGLPGFLAGLGWSALIAGGCITLLGGLAWLTADREPLVAGRALDLLVEVSTPAGLQAEVLEQSEKPYVVLSSAGKHGQITYLDLAQGRMENGRWILTGRFEIYSTTSERVAGAAMRAVEEQYFDLPLPGKPDLMPGWSDWLASPRLGNRTPPPAAGAFALRFRVVHRPEPDPAAAD